MLLGCIADDLTGATDLALTLAGEGMRTVQCTGVPRPDLDLGEVDALVVALKSRSIPAAEAVAQSLDAARALRGLGARRLFFKYCSTFDSTDDGNIGPVGEALLEAAGGGVAVACPAFPRAGRTVYAGHLFVHGVPLDESPMKDHPLNPMRDADLRRVLGRQARRPVGHVGFEAVEAGPERIASALASEDAQGRALCVVDALTEQHLRDIGTAAAAHALVTGGSGVAMGLPAAYVAAGLMPKLSPPPARMAAPAGRSAILSGSCSAATRAQVEAARGAGVPVFTVDAGLAAREGAAAAVLDWAATQPGDGPVLVSSSADPDAVAAAKARLGARAGDRFEAVLAEVAQGLVARGVRRLVVAGGETSGAVVQALGVGALTIGPAIDPGVPWTRSVGEPDLALALKSGNFGAPDFFLKAWSLLR